MVEIPVRFARFSPTLWLISWTIGGAAFYGFVADFIEESWVLYGRHLELYILAWALPGSLVAISSIAIPSARQNPEKSSVLPALMMLTPFGFLFLSQWHYLRLNHFVLVKKFGCGCRHGFNTNDLTLMLLLALIVSGFAASIISSRSLARPWRASYLLFSGMFLHCFYHMFLFTNIWL